MSKKRIIIAGSVLIIILSFIQCFPNLCSKVLVHRIKNEDVKSVSRLLSLGVNPNIGSAHESWLLSFVEKGPEYPFIEACNTGNTEIVRLLLKYGVSTSPEFYSGQTPFDGYLARYESEDIEMTQVLMENEVPLNWPSSYFGEPIMRAAGMRTNNGMYDEESNKGIIRIVEMLLDNRTIESVDNQYGFTALMKTAFVGNIGLAEWLIERGADIYAVDVNGETVLDYARRGESQYKEEMMAYLVGVMEQNELFD